MPKPRENIQSLHAYTPGEQPVTAPDMPAVIKLNTNENPYPPSPRVMQAIADVSPQTLRRYPSPTAAKFRQVAGDLHGLGPQHVLATNGGDELLRLLLTVYCEPRPAPRGGLGTTDPTYSLYPVLAQIQDTPIIAVSRDAETFSLPGELSGAWNQAGCRLAMLVNPHAPSGRFEEVATLRAIAEGFDGLLCIDEAYVDFAPESAVSLVQEGLKNVVLLRSLSKGYSLAGLRFGYALGHPEVIALLDKARDSYNTDALSQAAAVAAVGDQDYARDTWGRVKAERQRLADALANLGFGVWPSHANFMLARPPVPPNSTAEDTAEHLYRHLKAHHILVRYFNMPPLRDKLRITVGTPEENQALLDILTPATAQSASAASCVDEGDIK